MSSTRLEKDSMGTLDVPADALYGAQTQRAVNNFPISGQPMPEAFIRALILIKSAAAISNNQLECISADQADAITKACSELLEQDDLMQHFPVDVFQTGSGTSSNMNANEVIATLASRALDEAISANDHVNFGQSSNDVIPSAVHVSAAIELNNKLLPALRHLHSTIEKKAATLAGLCKTGRTHLMDAMPVRMDQSLLAWGAQIQQNIQQLEALQPAIQTLGQGGTAVGTGINAHPDFARAFNQNLSGLDDGTVTGCGCSKPADEPAHMHHRALCLQHAAMKGVGTHLVDEVGAAEHCRIRVGILVQRLEIAGEALVVRRFGGQLQLSGPPEIAVDFLIRNDPLDRGNAIVERLVDSTCLVWAEGFTGMAVTVSDAVIEMAAIAARCPKADSFGFEHHDGMPLLSQLAGSTQPGKARADDRIVKAAASGIFRCRIEGGRRIVPVGEVFHVTSSKAKHARQAAHALDLGILVERVGRLVFAVDPDF